MRRYPIGTDRELLAYLAWMLLVLLGYIAAAELILRHYAP